MNRDEWQQRARELALRGERLPQASLTDAAVFEIRAAQRERIAEELSNVALAGKQLAGHEEAHKIALQVLITLDATKRGQAPATLANTLTEHLLASVGVWSQWVLRTCITSAGGRGLG